MGRWRYGKGTNPCSSSAYGFDAQIGLFAHRSMRYRPISSNGLRGSWCRVTPGNRSARAQSQKKRQNWLLQQNEQNTQQQHTPAALCEHTRPALLSRRRASVLSCARYKKDAPRDCGSMKLLDPTGRGNDVKWMKIKIQQQKVMKKTHEFFVISSRFCLSKSAVT